MFRKSILAFTACAFLSACSFNTGGAPVTGSPPVVTAAPSSVTDIVSGLKAFNAHLNTDIANWLAAHPGDAAVIAKWQAVLGPEITALTGDVLPTTLGGVLTDVKNAVNAMPADMLSGTHKTELDLLLGGAQFFLAGQSPPATQAVASATLPTVNLAPVAPVVSQELVP